MLSILWICCYLILKSDHFVYCFQEKEQKLLQKALNDDKEKEEAESRKRIKKQQDESEKEQKRREKEQAELKKQLGVQKQASIMERFLKRSKDTSSTQPKLPSGEVTAQRPSCAKPEDESRTVIQAIDNAFATTCEASVDDIRRYGSCVHWWLICKVSFWVLWSELCFFVGNILLPGVGWVIREYIGGCVGSQRVNCFLS